MVEKCTPSDKESCILRVSRLKRWSIEKDYVQLKNQNYALVILFGTTGNLCYHLILMRRTPLKFIIYYFIMNNLSINLDICKLNFLYFGIWGFYVQHFICMKKIKNWPENIRDQLLFITTTTRNEYDICTQKFFSKS